MELPPVMGTIEEKTAFASKIKLLVPETVTSSYAIDNIVGSQAGVLYYIELEQELLGRLRADPQYMELANQRPKLQDLRFRRVTPDSSDRRTVDPVWAQKLLEYHGSYDVYLPEISDHLLNRSSSLIFSGLARVIPAASRNLMKEPRLTSRWENIRPLLEKIPLDDLRRDFDLRRFSTVTQTWNLTDLENFVVQQNEVEEWYAFMLEQLNKAINGPFSKIWFANENQRVFVDRLFGPLSSPKLVTAVETLGRRMARLYLSESSAPVEKVPDRSLVLRELPPYLAIYRGCVGMDCSTSASWAFPYSPFERDWFVEDEKGTRLGYVSGNITTVDGQPCLYIRDIHGPGLTAEDLHIIVNGFYLARSKYGAELMTLAHVNFAGQNHFPVLSQALQTYPFDKLVNQHFRDEWIRDKYLGSVTGSAASYDAVYLHSQVRLIHPDSELLGHFRIESLTEAGEAPTEVDLWAQLELAVGAGDASFMQAVPAPLGTSRANVIAQIRNTEHLPVETYHRAVEKVLLSSGVKFSQNLRRKHDGLFREGHLASPDAFTGDSSQKQSVRYVEDLLWRSPNPDAAGPLIRDHLEVFKASESFGRQVRGLVERAQPVDAERAKILWGAGFSFEALALSTAQWSWLFEVLNDPEATLAAYEREVLPDGLRAHFSPLAALLRNDHHDETIAEKAATLLRRFPESVKDPEVAVEVETSILQEDNLRVRVPLAELYLRAGGRDEETSLKSYRLLVRHQNSPNVDSLWRLRAQDFFKELPAEVSNHLRAMSEAYEVANGISLAASGATCADQLTSEPQKGHR